MARTDEYCQFHSRITLYHICFTILPLFYALIFSFYTDYHFGHQSFMPNSYHMFIIKAFMKFSHVSTLTINGAYISDLIFLTEN